MQVVIEPASATKYGFPHRTDKAALNAHCTNKATEVHRNVYTEAWIQPLFKENCSHLIRFDLESKIMCG